MDDAQAYGMICLRVLYFIYAGWACLIGTI